MRGDAVEILLAKCTLGTNQLIARAAIRGDKDHEHAMIGHEQETHVLDDAAGQRRRNKNAQSARYRRKNMARAFHNRFGSLRRLEFATNPLAVFGTSRGLRRYLLDEKTIGRGGGYASGGRVRLIKVALFFKIGHHVANGRGTQWFDVAASHAS